MLPKILRNLFNFTKKSENDAPTGFGMFFGVFVPNVTMMFGVILFLRLGIILGNIGITKFSAIILISIVTMVITSLSIAMIVTNMRVGGGGIYYILSRSLGMELGGAIGIALSLSQVITVSLCVSGFAYSLTSFLDTSSFWLSFTSVEICALVILSLIAFVSADFTLKAQFLIFLLLSANIISVFFSVPATSTTLSESSALYPSGLKFWEAFGLFYPALTGIEAGMGLSGNLKNPSRSLWLGSLLSLVFVAAVYYGISLFLYTNTPLEDLKAAPMILIDISRVPNLIYMGIWAATLSSALGALIGGPRMLQSIANDGVIPSIFGRTFGKYQEPRFALALTFAISLILILFTTIDQILPIQAMICLISYGTLNFVAGLAELIHSPRWRPTVRIPFWVSLIGGSLCLVLMFMINPMWSFITIILVSGIYFLLRFLCLDVSFQDFRENIIFYFSRFAVYHLSKSEDHAYHWHPKLLVFSNAPTTQTNMLHLASSFTKRSGLMTIASVLPLSWAEEGELDHTKKAIEDYLAKIDIFCLVETQAYSNPQEGIENLIKSYGLGSLEPNTIMFNLSENEDLDALIHIINVCKLYSKNLILFKDSAQTPNKLFDSPYINPKNIHIWWDHEYSGNFEIMLSFVHTLTSGRVWKKSDVSLIGLFQDESTKQHLMEYFQDFMKTSRVQLNPQLFVGNPNVDPLDELVKHSATADLTVIPLKPIEDDLILYKEYLRLLFDKIPDDFPSVFITSYDKLDHREIYLEDLRFVSSTDQKG